MIQGVSDCPVSDVDILKDVLVKELYGRILRRGLFGNMPGSLEQWKGNRTKK
jgi:hypothetical protein